MKNILLLFTVFMVIGISGFTQPGNINYHLQLKKFEGLKDQHTIGITTYKYFNDEILNDLVEAYIKYIFSKDSIPVYDANPGENTTLVDILQNKNMNNPAGLLKKKDTIMLIKQNNKNYEYLIDQKGRIDYETVFVENLETFEFMQVVQHKDFYDAFYGLDFLENWKYETGSFKKEIVLISPVQAIERNDIDYDEAILLKRRLSPIKMEAFDENQSELLIEDIFYDMYISPRFYDEEPESAIYSQHAYYKNANEKNLILMEILKDIKAGKLKAYAVKDDRPDMNKLLSYENTKELLSYTLENLAGIDEQKLKKYQEKKIVPVIKEVHEYQLDKWGEILYPEENNYKPIIVSTRYDTTGFDTTWVIQKKFLEPKLSYDTLEVYDEEQGIYADEVYIDTNWVLKSDIKNKIVTKTDNKIIHDKLENITGFRFYESWFLDKKNFSIHKQVNGIMLLTEAYRNNYAELVDKYNIELSPNFVAKKVYISFN